MPAEHPSPHQIVGKDGRPRGHLAPCAGLNLTQGRNSQDLATWAIEYQQQRAVLGSAVVRGR